MRPSFPDFQRPTSFYDVQPILDQSRTDQDSQEIQDKLKELQHSKWQYDNLVSQLHQLQTSCNREVHPTSTTIRSERSLEVGSNDAVYININSRTLKLQEAQQKLIQLQELMQNVSIDLDFHSLGDENKNNKPNMSMIKEFPAEFLRSVPGSVSNRSTAIPRVNPSVRRFNRTLPQQQSHYSLQQNNLSQDQPSSPKCYSTLHANSSLLDVFERSGPSLDSSDEESTVEIEEEPTEVHTEANTHNDHLTNPLLNSETTSRNFIHNPMEHFDRIERQVERTNSLCELLVVEQRRLAMVTDSLHSAISDLQVNRQTLPSNTPHFPQFPLSSLPMNSVWNNDVPMNSDFHMLGHAVNQCCHLLAQLQRDLATMQHSLESSGGGGGSGGGVGVVGGQTPAAGNHPFAAEASNHPFRVQSKSADTYECNVDRFDPEVTLNNRVPPGTRTNNYWDNFRSYSRQNLLSSGPSNVVGEDHTTEMVGFSGSQIGSTEPREARAQPPPRRTKRKVNKGQRQVEIGVRSPHADNRALAYGLSLETNGTNLHARHNQVASSIAAPDSPTNKVDKDTSTLKYSGARPKENRTLRPCDDTGNVNLLAERSDPALESVIRNGLTEHSTSPLFVSQLVDLLQNFNNDPMRHMALSALQGLLDIQQPNQSHLCKIFDSIAGGAEREFTPNLLENFMAAIQQSVDDCHQIEGAAAIAQAPHYDWHLVRPALSPFLFRRLSQVRQSIGDTLMKLESATTGSLNHPREASVVISTSGHEDDLAEADQSCDGIPDVTLTDNASTASNPEFGRVGGLDEIPTRLMSILATPSWSRAASSPIPDESIPEFSRNNTRQRNEPESATWFVPEDDDI